MRNFRLFGTIILVTGFAVTGWIVGSDNPGSGSNTLKDCGNDCGSGVIDPGRCEQCKPMDGTGSGYKAFEGEGAVKGPKCSWAYFGTPYNENGQAVCEWEDPQGNPKDGCGTAEADQGCFGYFESKGPENNEG